MPTIEHPYPGISVHKNSYGMTVVSLLYKADPKKANGKEIWVEAEKMWMSPWLYNEYIHMTDKSLFRQEYLIDFKARSGQLIFQMDSEATLCKSFPIPEHWTRYYGLDPHPGKPHAHLWIAVDPFGDCWAFREFWPSKVYGKPGKVPEDDNRYTIKQHVEVVQYLESDENPENREGDKPFNEYIYKRVIDYTARAFGTDQDNPEAENYQARFEKRAREIAASKDVDFSMVFEDAKKDHESGYETVNEWLKVIQVEGSDGGWKKSSRLHIFEDKCPELVYELRNIRRQTLTAQQAEKMDPTGKPVAVRNHMGDLLRYVLMANPTYVPRVKSHASGWKPLHQGVAY